MFLINKVVFILNVVAALLLLGSYLSPSSNPQYLWPVSFLGLGYIVLMVVNFIFILYWLVQAKLYLFISLGAIVLGFSHTGKFFQLQGRTKTDSDTTLKIISFNIQNFDERHNGLNPYTEFFEYIKTEQPDIVCIQEFNRWVGITSKTVALEELQKAMGPKFSYVVRSDTGNDLIIATKYKILGKKGIKFTKYKSTNNAMWADIVVRKDTIRVINVHFQSFLLNKVKLEELESKGKALESSRNIIKRLRDGFKNRVPQVDTVAREIDASPHPVILCGDFNDTPMSYTYSELTDKLKDSFIECGAGFASTYTGPYPSFRIDYILHNPQMRAFNYKRGKTYGSDHRVIQAEIALH